MRGERKQTSMDGWMDARGSFSQKLSCSLWKYSEHYEELGLVEMLSLVPLCEISEHFEALYPALNKMDALYGIFEHS